MKKIIVASMFAFSMSFGVIASDQASKFTESETMQLTDSELQTTKGGDIILTCNNGEWHYIGNNTFVCDGDSISISVE